MDVSDLQSAHRRFAAEAFNACWELIDTPDRSPDQDRQMIRAAESSFWHWMQVANHTAENESIGLWQLARVYCLAGEAETAANYASQCLTVTRDHQLDPFSEGYALEANARVQKALGQSEIYPQTLEQAWALVDKIDDPRSKEMLESDLRDIEQT